MSTVDSTSIQILSSGKQSKLSGEHQPQKMFQDPAPVKVKVNSFLSVTCSAMLHNLNFDYFFFYLVLTKRIAVFCSSIEP